MPILEERGYFWWHDTIIPERHYAPDDSVVGTLTIDEEGRINLELDGLLPSSSDSRWRHLVDDEPPTDRAIQGILKDSGKYVTLLNLARSGVSIKSQGISSGGYRALYCLVGDRRISTTKFPPMFQRITFDLEKFEDWLLLASIRIISDRDRYAVQYEPRSSETYEIDNGTLAVTFDLRAPRLARQLGKLSLVETAELTVRLNASVNIAALAMLSIRIADLFVLMTDTETDLEWPTVSTGEGAENFKLYFGRGKRENKPPTVRDCWVHFPAIHSQFGEVFSRWLNKCEEFGPGFYLYLGTRRGLPLYAEHRFVNLIWGLEAFHRKKWTNVGASPRLAQKIRRILDAVSADDSRWLSAKLKNAHEPTLEQRISETFASAPFQLQEEKIQSFARRCAQLRNDVSHFGGQRESGAPVEFIRELESLSDAISLLYQALLLQEIGVERKILQDHLLHGFGSYQKKKTLLDVGLIDASAVEAGSNAS